MSSIAHINCAKECLGTAVQYDNTGYVAEALPYYKKAAGYFLNALKIETNGAAKDVYRLKIDNIITRAEQIKEYLAEHPEEVGKKRPEAWLLPYTVSRPNIVMRDKEGLPYFQFTNHAGFPVTIEEKVWPTVEHYVQAMRFDGVPTAVSEVQSARTAALAVNTARKYAQFEREDWAAVQTDVLMTALRAKFEQHTALCQPLINTGDKLLIFHSYHDAIMGDGGSGQGGNRLGQALMTIRQELISNAQEKRAAAAEKEKALLAESNSKKEERGASGEGKDNSSEGEGNKSKEKNHESSKDVDKDKGSEEGNKEGQGKGQDKGQDKDSANDEKSEKSKSKGW
eukprot:CAMPEP_0175119696 /NCGR_PEP_ID=MMETSP0087-20121206/207_1 /TAXON_ID=136419 /ORGANISM="Unknown Unknown, Strain D1" /LENGTH=339 /DNA_ID=CAMNT_0016401057 /DNA_START=25 /DNA_END=1041 /DNA_ORIENTATION=-